MRIPNLSLYLRMVEFEFETEYKFEFETENKIFCEYQPWYISNVQREPCDYLSVIKQDVQSLGFIPS